MSNQFNKRNGHFYIIIIFLFLCAKIMGYSHCYASESKNAEPIATEIDSNNGTLPELIVDKPIRVNTKLVYAVDSSYANSRRLIVVCHLGVTKLQPSGFSKSVFEISGIPETQGAIFDPQFSPDGKKILFKIGVLGSSHGTYSLYLLDIDSQKVQEIQTPWLTFRTIKWSRDGRYLAFVTGGNIDGYANSQWDQPIRLCIFDLQTKVEKVVAEGTPVVDDFNWGEHATLFYGVEKKVKSGMYKPPYDIYHSTVDIFAYSADEETSHLAIQDGYRPVVSLDGNWLSYFAPESTKSPFPTGENWQFVPYGACLSVADVTGSNTKCLNSEQKSYPLVQWAPDSQSLITLKQLQYSPSAKAEVKQWNRNTGKFELLASISATDYKRIDRGITMPQFQLLSTFRKNVLIAKSDIPGHRGIKFNEKITLMEVDTSSHKLISIASVYGTRGFDVY